MPYVIDPTASYRSYDVASDGRFLMMQPVRNAAEEAGLPSIIVVQNWLEELKRLAPTR
jgi:hypothetical protein